MIRASHKLLDCRLLLMMLTLVLLAGCPNTRRKTLTAEVPKSGDSQARSRFMEARTAFLRDGSQAEAFDQLQRDFPDDPIAPWVGLYRGVALIKKGDFEGAQVALAAIGKNDLPPALNNRIALYRGVAKGRAGDADGALTLLLPQANDMRETSAGTTTQAQREFGDARAEFWAAVASAHMKVGSTIESVNAWDEYARTATPEERAWAVQQQTSVVAKLTDDQAVQWWQQESRRSAVPSGVLVARRVAAVQTGKGQTQQAASTLAAVTAAASEWQIPLDVSSTADVAVSSAVIESNRLAALLPSGSKQQRVAESIVAALGQAASGDGSPTIDIHNASDADGAVAQVAAIASSPAMLVIGPTDSASVDAASASAQKLGLPLISLSPRADERAPLPLVFHIMHSAENRARLLARKAYAKGVRRFAVLAATNGYGKSVATAFTDEVAKLGGELVVRVDYAPDIKSFAGVAGKLNGNWQAVFVPEQADRLELIAPALAAAGFIAKPFPATKAIGGRPVLVLSTAEGMTATFVTNSGRHCEGGMFAPGYLAGTDEPSAKKFEAAFVSVHGRAPTALEAYVVDAVAVAMLSSVNATSRSAAASAIAASSSKGVTGDIRFDSNHRRNDGGVIYTISNSADISRVAVLP
jgi:ABC-type branched-subunit amino acid transport system substrate-binding protein